MASLRFEYRENGIILKTLLADDAHKVLQFYKKNRNTFDYYETSKPANFYEEEFQRQLLEAESSAFLKGSHARYFLFDERFPSDIIGCISFYNILRGDFDHCKTGYKIDEEYRKMGYGTKMLSLATKAISEELGIHRIEAYVLPENTASIHLLEKCGYELEGLAKDYVRLRGEWQDHYRYVYIGKKS